MHRPPHDGAFPSSPTDGAWTLFASFPAPVEGIKGTDSHGRGHLLRQSLLQEAGVLRCLENMALKPIRDVLSMSSLLQECKMSNTACKRERAWYDCPGGGSDA